MTYGLIKVHCRTNLDIHPSERFPTYLTAIPSKGQLIESAIKRRDGVRLELEVVDVTWRFVEPPEGIRSEIWSPVIELHLPKGRFESIVHFQNWYGHLCGKYDQEEYTQREAERKVRQANRQNVLRTGEVDRPTLGIATTDLDQQDPQ